MRQCFGFIKLASCACAIIIGLARGGAYQSAARPPMKFHHNNVGNYGTYPLARTIPRLAMSLTLVLLSPLLLSLAQALSFPQPPSDESGEIFHVYPDLAVSNGSIPLYFALMQSFSGGYVSAGGIPGILVALDEINSNPYVLPGYTLHYTLNDNEVDRSTITCTGSCMNKLIGRLYKLTQLMS